MIDERAVNAGAVVMDGGLVNALTGIMELTILFCAAVASN